MQHFLVFSANTLACSPSAFPAALRRRVAPISAIAAPPQPLRYQTTHSMPAEKVEIFKSLESWASSSVLPLLKPVEKCWQPNEFLPDPSRPSDEFFDEVRALRERTSELPDDYFVVLVGDMITEDALPTYQTMINTLDGVRDETGASQNPWAAWTRAWTAEENRHGDLLRTYLYLSGRVDMTMIEKTVQYLLGVGMVSLFLIFLIFIFLNCVFIGINNKCMVSRIRARKTTRIWDSYTRHSKSEPHSCRTATRLG